MGAERRTDDIGYSRSELSESAGRQFAGFKPVGIYC